MRMLEQRVRGVLTSAGIAADAEGLVAALEREGLRLADARAGELVCRWIDTRERAVPPEADTIIRTVTRTTGDQSFSATHWLEGLRAPPAP